MWDVKTERMGKRMEKMGSRHGDSMHSLHHRACRSILAVFLLAVSLLGCSPDRAAQVREQGETAQQQGVIESGQQGAGQEGQQAAARPQTDGSERKGDVVPGVPGALEKGGTTPQEVVLSYLAGLRDQDLERMEAAFLDEGDLGGITRQYAVLCGIDQIPELASGGPVSLRESGSAERLFKQLEQQIQATDLGSIRYMGLLPVEKYLDAHRLDIYQTLCAASAKNDGGDSLVSQVVFIDINGDEYALFFDTIEKEGRWYIQQLGGTLAHMMDLDAELAGTLRLDAEDKEHLLQLLEDTSEDLPAPGSSGSGPQMTCPQVQGEGYDTPQQAAAAYLEGLKAHDMDQILRAFAVESYGEAYDLQAAMEESQGYIFLRQEVSFPPASELARALLCAGRKEKLEQDIRQQASALYLCSQYVSGTSEGRDEEGMGLDWEELPEKLGLETIRLLGEIPAEEIAKACGGLKDAYKELDQKKARRYGAQQVEPCALVFTCAGGKCVLFIETAQYDGKWYDSQLGNLLSQGVGLPVDLMGTAPLDVLDGMVDVEAVLKPVG